MGLGLKICEVKTCCLSCVTGINQFTHLGKTFVLYEGQRNACVFSPSWSSEGCKTGAIF